MNGTKPPAYDLVLIEWVDASRVNQDWIALGEIPEPYPHRCLSVGYLVAENEHGLTLVPNFGSVDDPADIHTYGGVMIPAHAVRKRKKLK